jgi:hypothetical protein
MTRRLTTALIGVGAIAASAVLLAGCASSPTASESGDSPDSDNKQLAVTAVWLDDGRIVGLVTQGSSTCVPIATDVSYENGLLSVGLDDAEPDAACTRDLISRVSPVGLPEAVDPTRSLEIAATYLDAEGGASLGALASPGAGGGEQGAPSAAWISDGEIALLTWGSSSRDCYPVASSVTVDAGVISVAMAEPASDLVCTADFGPQGTVLMVDAASDAGQYDLVLSGQIFDGSVRIPVLSAP